MTTPDTFDSWTAGAQARLAGGMAQAMGNIGVEHLLFGLLTVDSRASEQLDRAGVTLDAFLAAGEASGQWTVVREQPERRTEEPQSWQDVVESVILEARNEAFQESAEVGTEHLLSALARVPSDVAGWLTQFKLSPFGDLAQPRSAVRDASEPLITPAELQTPHRDATQADLMETCRILDAAANRAREGFRVVEDYVRWAWNDGILSQQLKELRHELSSVLRLLPAAGFLAARDTGRDVGTDIRTASEYRRATPAEVAVASLKRIQEALRSLEEYSKVIAADVSPRFEQLRYRIYTLEKAIRTTHAARVRFADHRLYVLATSSQCPHGIGPAILAALQAGASIVQLREKSLTDRELIQLAKYVRQWTREFQAVFIVNDRPDIAALVQADGVHLGQEDLDVISTRKIVGADKLIGVSTHNIEQARQAVLDGADYLGVGPCFPSSTKSFPEFPGLEFVREVAAEISLPWFAIGGITPQTLPSLLLAGVTRIAVSSAICASEDPGWATHELLHHLAGG